MLPEEVRQMTQAARDAVGKLIKQGHQAADRADGLMREAEAAIAALRETMRRTSGAADARGSINAITSARGSRP
jgi:hypothetical protein